MIIDMEETIKPTFRDLDTELLMGKLKATIFHRDATLAKVEELKQKQKRLIKYVEQQKMIHEQKIASLETYREDRYEEMERKKTVKVNAIVNFDNCIKAYTDELNTRDLTNIAGL